MAKFLTYTAVYGLLERDGKVWMMRRANTGYMDGYLGLPAGHIEEGETPLQAMVRELHEETGVTAQEEDLRFVHVGFRQSFSQLPRRTYNDYYFTCGKWQGEPKNCEPAKCDLAMWVEMDNLPDNMVPEVRNILSMLPQGRPFSVIRV